MESSRYVLIAAAGLFTHAFATPAFAEKQGGILHVLHRDSPPSMSIHEEATISTSMPMMGVFNNLVMFASKEKQNKLSNIVPDPADSWAWDASNTKLTFQLHPGVRWHDGKPFTHPDGHARRVRKVSRLDRQVGRVAPRCGGSHNCQAQHE